MMNISVAAYALGGGATVHLVRKHKTYDGEQIIREPFGAGVRSVMLHTPMPALFRYAEIGLRDSSASGNVNTPTSKCGVVRQYFWDLLYSQAFTFGKDKAEDWSQQEKRCHGYRECEQAAADIVISLYKGRGRFHVDPAVNLDLLGLTEYSKTHKVDAWFVADGKYGQISQRYVHSVVFCRSVMTL